MTDSLSGVRVLDLSRLLPGPACSWFLHGLGATVDRVETPGRGDFTRYAPPFVDGCGAYFAAVNRGKRSLGVHLRNPEGVALVRRLLPHYDVLIEGFKPGVMETMGLAPGELLEANPSLIVARLSGYGQTGPWTDRPGHDINYIGLTGMLAGAAEARDGSRALPTTQVADLSGAMVAAMGIASALYRRERTGLGEAMDISLTEAALSTYAVHVLAFSSAGEEPEPGGEMLTGGLGAYGTYRCSDGLWLTVGGLEPKFQALLGSAAGGVERGELAELFATRPRDAWVEVLADACVGPVLGIQELADHPLLSARGAVERLAGATWVRPPFSRHSVSELAVPGIGEHTDSVLEEAGIRAAERAQLRAAGAIGP